MVEKDILIDRLNTGKSQRKIAKEFGVNQTTISRWLRYYGLMSPQKAPRSQICAKCGRPFTRKQKGTYCSIKCAALSKRHTKLEDCETDRTRKALLEEQRGHICALCGTKFWNNIPVLLILDHIDGNSSNNIDSNLRLVCSNCDAQLPTYKSRNKGNGRFSRRDRYKKGKSY